MKRDMDVIRDILVFVEECDDPRGPGDVELPGYEPAVVGYHLRLLHMAGYIDASEIDDSDTVDEFIVRGLTMEGHELAQTLRDDTLWSKVKKRLGTKLQVAGLDLVLQLGQQALREHLQLPPQG